LWLKQILRGFVVENIFKGYQKDEMRS
jgi:hypothetical protein